MDEWSTFITGFFSGVISLMVLMSGIPEQTLLYRQGQIDALNGKVLFQLEKQPDGSTVWVRK